MGMQLGYDGETVSVEGVKNWHKYGKIGGVCSIRVRPVRKNDSTSTFEISEENFWRIEFTGAQQRLLRKFVDKRARQHKDWPEWMETGSLVSLRDGADYDDDVKWREGTLVSTPSQYKQDQFLRIIPECYSEKLNQVQWDRNKKLVGLGNLHRFVQLD